MFYVYFLLTVYFTLNWSLSDKIPLLFYNRFDLISTIYTNIQSLFRGSALTSYRSTKFYQKQT